MAEERDMKSVVRIIEIEIDEKEDGLFYVTSEDEPALFVAERDWESLMREIPKVLTAIYEERHKQQYLAFLARYTGGDANLHPWALIPTAIAHQALRDN